MDVSSVNNTAAIATIVRQLQMMNEVQTAIMSQLAASQQDMTAMLAAMGIGRHIDVQA